MRQTQSIISIEDINSFGEQQMIKPKLIQHHEKYLELHGEDKIVLMTRGEHRLLHRRLRKEGKCKVPIPNLHEIACRAHHRTKRFKDGQKIRNKALRRLQFFESMGNSIELVEEWIYNLSTGTVSTSSRFRRTHKLVLPVVDI